MIVLTIPTPTPILAMLSQKTKDGIRAPNKGHKRPLLTWFFCTHQKHKRHLCACVYSLWWAVLGNPLKGWPVSFAGSSNPIQSAAQSLEPFDGGLSLLTKDRPVKPINTVVVPALNPSIDLVDLRTHALVISLVIAEKLGAAHQAPLKPIETHPIALEQFGKLAFEIRAKSKAGNDQKKPTFSIFHHRKPIAQGISSTLALRFKRRYPASIVKFAAFEGSL